MSATGTQPISTEECERPLVLVLGPSNVEYTEGARRHALPALLEAALDARDPAARWQGDSQPLFYTPSMAGRAAGLTEKLRPDAVVLVLASKAFVEDVPIARIRRLFPRAYPHTRRLAEWLKRLAGGSQVKSPRGWLFRLPRWLLQRVIGGEPEVRVEDAIAWTLATLNSLLLREDMVVVCRVPSAFLEYQRLNDVERRRLEEFQTALERYCRERHVTTWSRKEELVRAGRDKVIAPDGQHPDRETRRFEAEGLADVILRLVDTQADSAEIAAR